MKNTPKHFYTISSFPLTDTQKTRQTEESVLKSRYNNPAFLHNLTSGGGILGGGGVNEITAPVVKSNSYTESFLVHVGCIGLVFLPWKSTIHRFLQET